MARRSSFMDKPVTYGAVGGTRAEDLMSYPPRGFRPVERRARLGSGAERFQIASANLMTWGVQRASGMRVADTHDGTGEQYGGVVFDQNGEPAVGHHMGGESVFGADGTPYIANGMTAVLKIPFGPFRVSAAVRVVYVIEEPSRVGFAYGTLKGHPVSGEESFLVEMRDDGSVWLTIRAFSRPGNAFYRTMAPVLRTQQTKFVKRYLRALLPVRAG